MPKIRCLLVDDHTLFRQGVRRLLETESDFEVVGEAADGGEAVEKARELRPDIVLMDIGMSGLSSFEASRQRDTRRRPRISTITPREREILKLLAEGNSVKEIAVILGLSVKTVEAHKFNLMRKLDIHNKAQLVTYAIQKKIIKIPVNG